MTVLFFGPRWVAVAIDAVQAETPVGEKCLRCEEPIVEGDQGYLSVTIEAAGIPVRDVAIHADCQALGIVGHDFGVCACTGFDTTTRAAARELWRRLGLDPT